MTRLLTAAQETVNLIPAIFEDSRAYAIIGEITEVPGETLGAFRKPVTV